jgi:hypothetical protein
MDAPFVFWDGFIYPKLVIRMAIFRSLFRNYLIENVL